MLTEEPHPGVPAGHTGATGQPQAGTLQRGWRWRILWRTAGLLTVLVILNSLARLLFPSQIDLTQRRSYTLAPQTGNVLEALKEPVDVIILAPKSPRTAGEQSFRNAAVMLREFLDICQKQQPLLHVQELDPVDSPAGRSWQERFPDVLAPCVVIARAVAGEHEVLTTRDLVEFRATEKNGAPDIDFLGEQAFTAALTRLNSGRKPAVIYVTTGHGELSIADQAPDSPLGLGLFAEMLTQFDCRVESLDLRGAQRVPHDASLVIVAGGEVPWESAEADLLDTYLRQGGRVLFLADYHFDSRQKRPVPTGLESLCERHGVRLGDERVYSQNFAGQVEAVAAALPATVDHPLVRSLNTAPVYIAGCRCLRLSAMPGQRPVRMTPVLVSQAAPRAWAEGDPVGTASPTPGGARDLDGPVAMAAAIERPDERDPSPLMVVIGSPQVVSNRTLTGATGRIHASLGLSCVNWLRGRRELMGDIPPRRRAAYHLSGTPEDHRGLVWKTTILLCAVIGTSGFTVWTMRRIG
ncbi:MAG: GldG family protein [Planctomycetes bacterium]|nr:GldG family protein [Planctomycetota bacterium]